MYKNVLRSMLPSNFRCSQLQLYRHLSGFRVNSIQNSMIRPNIDKEEEEALKIEANLFEQSSIQYKPVTAAEVMLKKKINQKLLKPTPKHFPKPLPLMRSRTRLDRQADSQIINDAELGLEFIKLNLNDPRLNKLMISARSKKRRDKDYQIVIEGRRLIEEALDCGLHLQTVIFSQKDQLLDIKEAVALSQKSRQTKIYKVPQHDLKIWSSLSTPPGVLAIFERPSLVDTLKKFENASTALPITVVCDNIREPNNLGSIIRSCAALPCLQVVTTKGCCDPWESKSLRGGCGGHFRLAIRDNIDWNDVPLMIPPQVAHNIRVFIAENNMVKLPNSHAAIEYTDITDTGDHNVLIIGGETHGVSTDAYRFLETFAGNKNKCVYIPLAAGIDSLNVASALTLILYELRRCILKPKTTLLPTTVEEENKINIL